MTGIAKSKLFGVLAAAAVICGAMSHAQATPLDKLIGKNLAVGNLIFSNIAAPSFVGAGPGAIDVQGIIVIDPVTGKQQTGLRFVAPFSQSAKAGPHEIVLNVQYSVTDTTGQLNTPWVKQPFISSRKLSPQRTLLGLPLRRARR